MIDLDEIVAGAVVWLDPHILCSYGLTCGRPQSQRITKIRPYLCIRCDAVTAAFVPLSSKPGTRRHPRLEIPAEHLVGRPNFTRRRQFVCDGAHVYKGPVGHFQAASQPDRGWRGSRTRVDTAFLPEILGFLELGRRARGKLD